MTNKSKLNIIDLKNKKFIKEPISWITAYDLPFAQTAENAGIDMILVGDSGGMVQLGYHSTNPVTMDEMILLSKSVRRGAPVTFIVGDMPQGSYEVSDESAVRNAMRFVKEADCDAIKLEGGERISRRVQAIVDAGIIVFGHLGLTPQSSSTFGGYRVQGKTRKSFEETVKDAEILEQAGASALLLEAMPEAPAQKIAERLKIPVLGIGAGKVDGQLVIMHDILGFYQKFRPWFAKCYVPEVIKEFDKYISSFKDLKKLGREARKDGFLVLAEMAIRKYIEDVKTKKFPGTDYVYPITEKEIKDLQLSKYW